MLASTCWRLEGTTAHLEFGPLSAIAELDQPQHGLAQLRYDGAPLAGWLLGVEATGDLAGADGPAWTPADAYVRGHDLVVAYGAGPNLPFGMQIYCARANSPAGRR